MQIITSIVLIFAYLSHLVNGFRSQRLNLWKISPNQRHKSLCSTVNSETFRFESNVSRVMDIIINSLYSNKDVFIRELVSNAADACDKKRFKSISRDNNEDLHINVAANRQTNTLTISDTGIGMSKDELINNLGRIAESGTQRFLESMNAQNKKDVTQVGQFGVGFYSGFLVADKISVVTKAEGDLQYKWEANANSLDSYTILRDDSDSIHSSSGTNITLHMKEDCDQYLDPNVLQDLLSKYSEFISFPIYVQKNVTRPIEVVVDDNNIAIPSDEGMNMPTGSVDMTQSPPPGGKVKTMMKNTLEWKQVNEKKPLWLRKSSECNEADYSNFYKSTFKAFDEPMTHSHFSVEGNIDFKALLFIPTEIPYDLNRDMFASTSKSLRLYVKRVFINDNFDELLPRWLLFIRGVVDSDDLPLNVGREILQQSRTLRIIKQRLVKKSIDMISHLALTNETHYLKFWKNFGRYIKVGMIEDQSSKEELIPLCRFHSSFSSPASSASSTFSLTSLPDYVSRMTPGQKNIYYVVGDTLAQAAMSPSLERLKKNGYEVIYVSEPLDEMTLQNIESYMDKKIVDVGKEKTVDSDMTAGEKREKEELNEDYGPLRDKIKEILGEKVTKVEVSTRLVDSPAILVQGEYGVSPTMQKYLRSQSIGVEDGMGGGSSTGMSSNLYNQAVLEINPLHSIIKNLKSQLELEDRNGNGISPGISLASEAMKDRVNVLFNTAAISAGYVLDNAAEYAKLINKLMAQLP